MTATWTIVHGPRAVSRTKILEAPRADDVRRLVESDQHERALSRALAAWRASRSRVIGDAIMRIDHRLPAIDDRATKAAFQAAWLETAAKRATATRVGWLARTLAHKLPIVTSYWGVPVRVRHAALFARLDAIERLPPDPRVAAALARILAEGRLTADGKEHELYERCGDLLIQIGDPAPAALLQAVIEEPRAKTSALREALGTLLPRVVARLAASTTTEPDDRDDWESLCTEPARAPDRHQRAAALLDAVLDAPDDLELRAVCADALLDDGDPRGEFIVLQLQATQTPESRRRMRALETAHAREWLGDDLSTVLTAVRFRYGFPASATLAGNHVATEAVWQRALEDRRLATITTLFKGKASKVRHDAFLRVVKRR